MKRKIEYALVFFGFASIAFLLWYLNNYKLQTGDLLKIIAITAAFDCIN